MGDQVKNVLIGLFVVAACGIIVFMILFLHPKVGDEAKKFKVRFANIDKVNVGTRVTYGGKPVGEVVEIKEIDDPKNPRPSFKGYVYLYELTLAVDSSTEIFNTDDLSLKTSGLLGDKSVAITPQPLAEGEVLVEITPTDIIYANETGSVEETLKEFKDLSDKFELALDSIINTLGDIKTEKLWKKIGDASETIEVATESIDGAAKNIKSITKSINKPDELNQTVENIHTISEKVLNSWAKVNEALEHISKVSTKLETASEDVLKITTDGRIVIEQVAKGEGTFGQVIMKDDLYLRAVAIMNKAETVMDDINHYGVLFHLDKGWQRLRARRANLLGKLCSPQEFRNYFNEEINQINTSLSRVSQVMQQTQTCCSPEELACDQDFTKVFAELLRRVDGLEKSLQMYNDQLQEVKSHETELVNPCYYNNYPRGVTNGSHSVFPP